MVVSADNTKVFITITKNQKIELEKNSKIYKCLLSNLCAKIISDYLDSKLKGGE